MVILDEKSALKYIEGKEPQAIRIKGHPFLLIGFQFKSFLKFIEGKSQVERYTGVFMPLFFNLICKTFPYRICNCLKLIQV